MYLFVILSLLSTALLTAECPQFKVGVDFLYWNSCLDDLDYGIHFDSDPLSNGRSSGDFLFTDQGFSPGGRIFGVYEGASGFTAFASYTFYYGYGAESIWRDLPTTLFPTVGHAGLNYFNADYLKASSKLLYQTGDLLVGQRVELSSCDAVTPYIGLQLLSIHQLRKLQLLIDADGEYTEWNSTSFGVGIKAGIERELAVTPALRLVAKGSGSLLLARDRVKTYIYLQDAFVIKQTTFKDSPYFCMPGAYLSLELRYLFCLCGLEADLHVGYDFTSWWNTPSSRRWLRGDDAMGISRSAESGTLMLHGLFVGVTTTF